VNLFRERIVAARIRSVFDALRTSLRPELGSWRADLYGQLEALPYDHVLEVLCELEDGAQRLVQRASDPAALERTAHELVERTRRDTTTQALRRAL
jgi:hypothetical protein